MSVWRASRQREAPRRRAHREFALARHRAGHAAGWRYWRRRSAARRARRRRARATRRAHRPPDDRAPGARAARLPCGTAAERFRARAGIAAAVRRRPAATVTPGFMRAKARRARPQRSVASLSASGRTISAPVSVGISKSRGSTPTIRMGDAIERQRAAHGASIAGEAGAPQAVRNHGDWRRAGAILIAREGAPGSGLHAEEVAGNWLRGAGRGGGRGYPR